MAKDLEDYKRDTGKNFFYFWIFECDLTPPILGAGLLCTILTPFFFYEVLVDPLQLFGSYQMMLVISFVYSFIITLPISLLGALMHWVSFKGRNEFIDKVVNNRSVSYLEYNEYENILHWSNYEGKVYIDKKEDVKEIEFN